MLFHTYDIIYYDDIGYDLNYDTIGQTFDIAVCRIVVRPVSVVNWQKG